MPKLAIAICFILAPLADIACSIRPQLSARSLSQAIAEITLIDGAILEGQFLYEFKTIRDRFKLKICKELIFSKRQSCAVWFQWRLLGLSWCQLASPVQIIISLKTVLALKILTASGCLTMIS